MKLINNFLLVLVFVLSKSYAQNGFKKVQLFKNHIILEVPSDWRYKSHYLTFSNYEVKSDEMLFDAADSSIVTINVYDSIYRKKIVVNNDRVKFEQAQDSFHFKNVQFIETGIKEIGNVSVGFLKYKLAYRNTKDAYMIQSFFKDSHNFYYEIEIFNFKKSARDFKPIADKIFNSLSFNLD